MSGAATRGGPSVAFWQERFASQRTPWDRGAVNPALAPLLEAGQLSAGARVLVPGCGAGYEVETLAAAGFRPIGVDYAPTAVGLTRARLAQAGLDAEVIEADGMDLAVLRGERLARNDVYFDRAVLAPLLMQGG